MGNQAHYSSRVRGRIENVLDWAKVRGYRQGENPARWEGHLDHLLPSKSRVQAIEHHLALPTQRSGRSWPNFDGGKTLARVLWNF